MKRYVVITGASSGIGYETALRFAQRGKNLIIIARSVDKLEQLQKEINVIGSSLEVVIKPADLSKIEDVYALYDSLKSFYIETWINNAGFGDYCEVYGQNLLKMENMLKLNIEAVAIFSTLYTRDYRNKEI